MTICTEYKGRLEEGDGGKAGGQGGEGMGEGGREEIGMAAAEP